MMKKSVFCFIICCPAFLFAQKGSIIPDTKPQISSANTANQNETKVWIIGDYLLHCKDDSTKKCYLIKENGINKTVPIEDIYNFDYQEGLKFTVWVKEELKTPPISAAAGIYKYKVVKIISKVDAALNTPSTVTNTSIPVSINETTTANEKTTVALTSYNESPNLFYEIEKLKKQVQDLKKQVDVMKLQIELQLQLMQKK